MKVSGWHLRVLLHIPDALILWDFDFLRGLAPVRLDEFSIGRYQENCESFDLNAAKFESGAMRFCRRKIARALEVFQNKDSTPVYLLICYINDELKLIQNRSKNLFSSKRTTIHHR